MSTVQPPFYFWRAVSYMNSSCILDIILTKLLKVVSSTFIFNKYIASSFKHSIVPLLLNKCILDPLFLSNYTIDQFQNCVFFF